MVKHTPREGPRTTLQKHLDFFDPNHDDIITLYDSYRGFRDLDYPAWFAALTAFGVHSSFSYPTLPKFNPNHENLGASRSIVTLPLRLWSYVPDPLMRIYLSNIQCDVHGSDTQTYNTQGNFESVKFNQIFENYSSTPNKDGLTKEDTYRMWLDQRRAYDLFGPLATAVEWIAVWYTLNPKDGIIKRDDIKAVFDGSIFYRIAESVQQSKDSKAKRD